MDACILLFFKWVSVRLRSARALCRCAHQGGAPERCRGWVFRWLAGDTARQATSDEVQALRREAAQLKEALAETVLENRLLKKST